MFFECLLILNEGEGKLFIYLPCLVHVDLHGLQYDVLVHTWTYYKSTLSDNACLYSVIESAYKILKHGVRMKFS